MQCKDNIKGVIWNVQAFELVLRALHVEKKRSANVSMAETRGESVKV